MGHKSQSQPHLELSSSKPNVRFQENSSVAAASTANQQAPVPEGTAAAIQANLEAARTYRQTHLSPLTNSAIEKSRQDAMSGDAQSCASGETSGRLSMKVGSPGSLASVGSNVMSATSASQKVANADGKAHHPPINPLNNYGAAMAELHNTFSVVNGRITSAYIAKGENRGTRGSDAAAGRAMAIAGDGAANVLKMAQKLQSLRDEDTMVQRVSHWWLDCKVLLCANISGMICLIFFLFCIIHSLDAMQHRH